MKRIIFLTGLLAIISAFTFSGNETLKKDFEGSITYGIEYIKVPDEVRGMESMLPQQMTMSIKGDKIRIEQEVMGGSQIIVTDNKNKTAFMIMDMMGQKIAVNMTKEDLEKAEKETTPDEITYVDGETKTIMGYKCNKAIITNAEKGSKNEVYYTTKIKNSNKDYKGLPGMPLQYITKEGEMTLRMTASKISEEKLSDDLFEKPEGYDWMTMDELENFGK